MSLDLRREIAGYLLGFATNDEYGRGELDVVYQRITEGRDGPSASRRARYSSCADLAHWLLMRLGVDPATPWLNREEETPAQGDWKDQVNLNYLCPPPIGRCDVASKTLGTLECGDIVVVNNAWGGHVMCVRGVEYGQVMGLKGPVAHTATGRLVTSEYGQPGGIQKSHSLPLLKVLSHVSLAKVPFTRAPDISPLENYLIGEELDSLERRCAAAF